MRRALPFLIALALGAAGFLVGRWSRAGAVEQCEERAATFERERDQARAQSRSGLASALALASRGLEHSRHEAVHPLPPTVPSETSEPHTGFSVSIGDAPDAGAKDNMLAMMLGAKSKAREALDRMQRATRLSSDQRASLDRGVTAMNLALGDAIERFAKYGQAREPRSRDLLPIAIDALTALKRTDDDFRATLDPTQSRALDEDGFDLMSQIDPLIFLRLMPTEPKPANELPRTR